ncbi:enoyl-CoA hydratase [Kibdelosporangium banguiense]|uniref:Enoyl-CoA hydratase n=1 Tax=Kibdelosporangium banguiense TaxID=1365924 RepID=A0ABS4T5B1_9PSEU|nr:enoyl-CoA hydratase-related protein [Kibdelosporangium banguiense]MBP2319650.1 enoyl-CoA hydratase [Kibdelosporangium banguiense]
MQPPLVRYELTDGIASITMDDGARNTLSPQMIGSLNAALDQAQADRAVVLLTGRDGLFSDGFDSAILREGGPRSVALVRSGFKLAARLLAFPRPVVVKCTGHAAEMGALLVLSGDFRVGAAGYQISADGLQMWLTATEIIRRSVVFLDLVVPEARLAHAARDMAIAAIGMDMHKLRARQGILAAIRNAIDVDFTEGQPVASGCG